MCYCYEMVLDAASQTDNPIIKLLLLDAAKVLHDEEWWISSDICLDEYKKTLLTFSKKWLRKQWRIQLKEDTYK